MSRNNWSSAWLYTVEDSFRSKNFESKWYDKELGGVGVFLYTLMKFLSFFFSNCNLFNENLSSR